MTGPLAGFLVWCLEGGLLCAAVLAAPVLALRRPFATHGHRSSAVSLYRARRDVLDRDRAAGLLDENQHREAGLEIDRRLLAEAAADTEAVVPDQPTRTRWLLLVLASVPCAAVALYAVGGHPLLPAQPLAARIAADRARQQRDERLVHTLRDALAQQDPDTPATRQGYLLLAQTEAARGDWAAAAAAWRNVLAHGGFDPAIAVQAAEAQCRAAGRVGSDEAALFRRALEDAPQDAPWRALAEQRIARFEHEQDPH